eukprot:403359517
MYDQFKANYQTENPNNYQSSNQQQQPNSAYYQTTAFDNTQGRGRRDEILNLRRKEKIKNSLQEQLGVQFKQDIELIVNQQADQRLAQNQTIDLIQEELKAIIIAQNQAKLNSLSQTSSISYNQHQGGSQTERISESQRRKRHLPVNEKSKVFNEWAAVAQHQDEIVQQTNLENKLRIKNRQQIYKDELDYQNQIRQQNQLQNRIQDQMTSQAMIDKDKMSYLQFQQAQEEKKKQNEKLRIENQLHSNGDYKDKLHQQHEYRLLESQRFKSQYDQTQQELSKQDQEDKLNKNRDQNQYKNMLDYQANLKLKPKENEQNLNGQWQSSQMDMNRQRYQDLINGKQNSTVASMEQLNKYLQNNRQDEKERFYSQNEKHEQEKYMQGMFRDMNDQQKRLDTKRIQSQVLGEQVGMRNMLKQSDKDADQYFGQLVRAQAQAEEMQTKAKQDQFRKRQTDYSNTLQEQMKNQNLMKQFDTVMTEHERRVNDADIRAYQNVDQLNLYHKAPGIKKYGEEIQDKYLEKAYQNQSNRLSYDFTGSQPMTARNTSQHFQTVNQNQHTDQTQHQPHLNPNLKFQSQRAISFDPLKAKYQNQISQQPNILSNTAREIFHSTDQKLMPTQLTLNNYPNQIPDSKLQQVRQNMELPQTLLYRHNTGNKTYGFEQFIQQPIQQKPTLASMKMPDGDFPYNYTVAGNYKIEKEKQQQY